MNKVAGMRRDALLLGVFAHTQRYAWTPIRRAPGTGLRGASFTSLSAPRRRGAALILPLILAAVQALSDGRTPGSFAVSSTGEAQYSIPIFAPPGVNGLAPELAITYGHRHGGTLAGVGWGVSGLSAIHRCEKTWAQNGVASAQQNALDDRYCLDGNQLRLYSGTYGAAGSTYRTEIESYTRITALGSAGNGPASFKVEHKNGLIYEYGNTTDSRILSLGQPEARAWAVNRISDRSGNHLDFGWHNDTLNGSYRVNHIDYASNTILFAWESKPAGEVKSGFITGSKVQEIHRLQSISVWQSGSLLRRYDLTYEGPLSSTSRSRLASIRECAGAICRDPTTFDYHDGSAGLMGEVNTGAQVTAGALPLDVNGDGREDLVFVSSSISGSGTWQVMFANASGGYDPATDSLQSNLNYTGAIPIDYNHDGSGDILVPYSGNTWWVMLGSASGLGALVTTAAPATTTGRGTNARALDIDGDGREDLVWADLEGGFNGGDAIRYRLRNTIGAGFSSTVSVLVSAQPPDNRILTGVFTDWAQKQPGRTPDFNGDGRGDIAYRHEKRTWQEPLQSYAVTRTMWALCAGGGCSFAQNLPGGSGPPSFGDFNGDGLTDLFYYSGPTQLPNNASWWYAFSRGTSFAPPVAHSNLNPFTLQWVILDWDADGYDDLLAGYGTAGEWRLLRATGVGFGAWTSVGITLPGFPATLVTDIDGDGLHDFAYAQGNTWRYRKHLGTTPDLLTRVTDGYGNTVDVTYASLTVSGVHTKTTGATFPEQEWQGPMAVVKRHTASDGIGGTYSIDHTYEGARQDRAGRGFEGFYRHTRVDDRNGTKTHAYFARRFPHTGSPDLTEVRQSNNTLIESTDFAWSVLTPTGGTESRTLPFPIRVTGRAYGVGATYNGTLLRTIVTDTTVDAVTGTATEVEVTTTEAAGANGLHGGATWTERTVHSNLLTSTSGTNWCIGRPQRTQQINSHSLPDGVAQTRALATTWDPASCRPTQQVIEPDTPQWRVQADLDYDGFGNLASQTVSGLGLTPRTWATSWGDGRFPLSVTNPLNQTMQRTFDARFGLPATETDPNGLQTAWLYDDFGRRTRETRPDHMRTDWSYVECSSNCGQTRLNVTATEKTPNGSEIRSDNVYLDTYDRPLFTRTQLMGGGYSRVERQYDDLGRLTRESAPCTEGACPSPLYWTEFRYDLIDRPTQISRPFTAASTQTTMIAYAGLTMVITDPLGKDSVRVEDGRGRLARSTDDDGYSQTFDFDASGNPVRVTDSAGQTLQQATFNIRGLRETATDADLGHWQYDYNAFGEPTSHTDANNKTTSYTWDALGRPLTRIMPEGVGTISRRWTWGTLADNTPTAKYVGRLKESQVNGTGVSTYRELHAYDTKGRHIQTEYFQGAARLGTVNIAYATTTHGLVDSLTYPESTAQYRLKLKYEYSKGLLKRVKDYNAPATVFWEATTMDAYGQIIDETLGGVLKTIRRIEPRTGFLEAIQSGPLSDITLRQDLEYVWDKVGNLRSRQDHNQSLTEAFEYDDLQRLTRVTRNTIATVALNYDYNGNILSKSDVGTYTYDPVRIHAVTSISGSPGRTFRYDPNGNMTNRNGAELLWFADNRLKRIRKNPGSASNSSELQYGPDGQRWYHKYNAGGTIYTHVNLGGIFAIVTRNAIDDFRHTIHANGVPVALYSRKTTGTNTLRYLLRDHLGSVDVITTSAGAVELPMSFDAFGERRNANWNGAVPSADLTTLRELTRHGYTDHEHLDSTGIIHMNGRVYDPAIARFVSADPFIDGVTSTQGWNRYSYVGNNPLSYTDPSGYAGVPQGPDSPPEGTPGNPLSCAGWGISLRCDPLQYIDNARRRDQVQDNYLTPAMALALVERMWLRNQGTANYSPHLGEAPQGEDFHAENNSVESIPQGTQPGPKFEDWKVLVPFLLWFDLEDYAIEQSPEDLRGPLRAISYLLGVKGATQGAARGTTTVIGKLIDLRNLAPGERSLLNRLPNLGSPKANWAQNSGVLRQEMSRGLPIRDASVGANGALINDTGFLRAERNLLRSHGWTYDPTTTMWYPPGL